jgi:hypothetical protein
MWTSTGLVAGNMIGSGIFVLPASPALYGPVSLVGWVVTVTSALFLALEEIVFKGFLLILGGTPVYVAMRWYQLRKPAAATAPSPAPVGGLPIAGSAGS